MKFDKACPKLLKRSHACNTCDPAAFMFPFGPLLLSAGGMPMPGGMGGMGGIAKLGGIASAGGIGSADVRLWPTSERPSTCRCMHCVPGLSRRVHVSHSAKLISLA